MTIRGVGPTSPVLPVRPARNPRDGAEREELPVTKGKDDDERERDGGAGHGTAPAQKDARGDEDPPGSTGIDEYA
jgi:hypothetical protein